MRYDVIWEDNALSEVAAEFVDSKSKVAVIDASRQITVALHDDPYENGEHLSEGLYYIDRSPLRAIYSIDSDARQVRIARFRRI